MQPSTPPSKIQRNGIPRDSVKAPAPLRKSRPDKLTDKDLEFVTEGLQTMNRLIEEATQIEERMEELRPRFKVAAIQKAWFVLAAYLLGTIVLLLSIAWSGLLVIQIRIGIVGFLVGLHFVPVHFFVRGDLRSEARLVRELDKQSLARAKKAAEIGQATNKELRRKLGPGSK